MVDGYCLLGERVSESPSPAMMNAAFRYDGVDALYEALSVERKDFPARFLELKQTMRGMNLTIPFKTEAIELIDDLDDVSRRIGAVNVVKRSGSRWLGLNTDVQGIAGPLREHGADRIPRSLVIGTGGAARAFCEAMRQLSCGEVTVVSRHRARGEAFASAMSTAFPGMAFVAATPETLGEVEPDLIFNASPIGTAGLPLPSSLVRVIYGHATVFDAVYRPMKTELLRAAEEKGARTIYGYEMLLGQGMVAYKEWTGRSAPRDVMLAGLRRSLGERS